MISNPACSKPRDIPPAPENRSMTTGRGSGNLRCILGFRSFGLPKKIQSSGSATITDYAFPALRTMGEAHPPTVDYHGNVKIFAAASWDETGQTLLSLIML